MRYPNRVTMCVSSQAFCAMNCPFCATGQADAPISTAEIVEQVLSGCRMLARGEVAGGPGRVSNVVPSWGWANPRELQPGYQSPTSVDDGFPWRTRMSARGITVSTVGSSQWIRQLADEGLPFTPRGVIARRTTNCATSLCPLTIGSRSPRFSMLRGSTRAKTKRRVSIEYALIKRHQ